MKFIDIAKTRHAVRSYLPRPVEPEKVAQILEAAHVAPTAGNCQPVRLLVLQTPESLEKAAQAADLYGAPLAILVCSDHNLAWTRPYDGKQTGDIDAAILTDHRMLQATELGLGSVWVCYFHPDRLRAEFQLPPNLEPVNLLALGYAADGPGDPDRFQRERIPLHQLVCQETF